MLIFTLLAAVLMVLLGIVSAFFYVLYHQEKYSQDFDDANTTHQNEITQPINLSSIYDFDHSDTNNESENEVPDLFSYLKKAPSSLPSSGLPLSNDPLSNSKRRVVVSKEVDLAIEKLIEELIEFYIFSWYKSLVLFSMSPSGQNGANFSASHHRNPADEKIALQSVDQLRRVLKNDIWMLLSSFIDRLYSANYVHFVAISLVNRIIKHVQFMNRPKTMHSASGTSITLSASSDSTFHSYLQPPDHSINSTSKSKRTFSTQSSNTSMSSTSSSSSMSSSLSNSNLLGPQPADSLLESIETVHNSGSQANAVDQAIVFHLVSHLVSASAEHNLLHRLAFFLLDSVLKETLEEKSILQKSKLFKLLLSEFLSAAFAALINRLSDPTFVNYQIVRLIKKRINIKDLIYIEPTETSDGRSLSSNFSVYDLKICLAEHNFNRLMEILDNCDDIDSLKTIRLHIIEEILDAAVIDYLNKQQNESGRNHCGSSTTSKSISPFNRKQSLDASLSTRSNGRSNLMQQLRLTVPGTLAFPGTSKEGEKENGTSETDMFDAIRRHFNFNANINSKVKVLQAKDLRRLVSKLRYAKTICEQKIQMHKRNSALLIPDSPGPLNPTANSLEDSKFSFDISFNSELVRSFRRHNISESEPSSPVDSTDASQSDHLFPNLKPKKKNIFKFKVIMANDFCREYFKRFLQQSLFNLQSGEFHRSSRNKFRKDVLICECCAYLVEVWETIQQVFEHFYHFFKARSSIQSHRQSHMFPDLHALFSHCYHLVLQTVSDSRFYYTFSDRFLQLPNEVMKSLEAFLLGDVELSMLKRTFDDFSIDRFATRLDFSPEDHLQMANSCLSRIDLPQYLNVFVLLEKIIFKCLCDEFYPQFLISTEYDEMLYNTQSNSIDVDRDTANNRWCSMKFTQYDTPDQVLNKQFASMLAANQKPIHKVQLDGDQVDIVKNRSILLNCLEFPFLCLTSMQFIVQNRLSLKIYMKDFISQICSSNNEIVPMFMDVAQVLNRDIVYYNDIYSHLHSVICASYCWLHSDFSCSISDVQVQPVQRPSSSIEGKIISFVENIFSSDGPSTSGTSTSHTSNPLLEHNYRLTFRVCTTAFPSGLEHLPAYIRSQLQSTFSPFWSMMHSFDGFIELFNKWMTPNLRMMTYLCRTGLHDFVHNLGNMMEPKHALLMATIPMIPITENAQQLQKQGYWDKLIKQLANDQLAVKRLFRHEVRDQMKKERLKTRPQYNERLSFKKLLDKESGSTFDSFEHSSRAARSNSINSTQIETSANMMQMGHCLNQLFSRLTVDGDLIKTNGFLNLVQYECGQPVSQPINAHESPNMCLRCLLIEHLIENNNDNLNGFILQSLCLLAFKSGLDPRTLVSPNANQESNENKEKSKTKLMEALQLPQQATKLFLQSTNSLPKVNGFNQSGQLLFLHARSLLTERSSSDILDFTLSSFRHFDRFCPTCTEKLHTLKPTNELRINVHSNRKRGSKIKFRLFNIEPNHQTSQHQRMTSSGGGSEVALDVVANLKNGSITDVSSMTSSSMLHENIGTALFDDDGFGSIEPFSLGLGEDIESNLIEPLFQLLVEVFELKGTMIRTFRRTLMLGFRLVFGQTMFSKQIKMSLRHLFTDGNILQLIALLQATVHSWNDEIQSSTLTNAEGAKMMGPNSMASVRKARMSNVASNPTDAESLNVSSSATYLSDLNELLDSFPLLLDSSLACNRTTDSVARPGSAASTASAPIAVAITPPDVSTEEGQPDNDQQTQQQRQQQQQDELQAANIARLQILAKQLLFASVPTFLNHLFGAENTITGLNKSFDILQYQALNKQLIYEFLEAFLLEYYPEFKKI